jgi:maltose alpha-D-glucosyltransferase/alpha-amylase
MLRSFDYAAWAALDKIAARGIQLTDARHALALQWRDEASQRFLSDYRETAQGAGIYPSEHVADGLLKVFLLQKAFYEVQYELGSRPAWLSIPVRGILNLLAPLSQRE